MAKDRGPFVPTHRLAGTYPGMKRLKKGLLVRQINPFAGAGPLDQVKCLDEHDWNNGGYPWIFVPAELEPLPSWEAERQKMIDGIMNRK